MPRVPNIPCAGGCGNLLWGGRGSLPKGEATCRRCRAANRLHGTANSYRHGCRCQKCRDGNSLRHKEYTAKRKAGEYPVNSCMINGCERTSQARSMCLMHYKRWARANRLGRSPSDAWGDQRKSNYHSRRARMNGAQDGDRVMLAELLQRDSGTCPACGQWIDSDIPWPDPFSPSIDHTIPVSRGGEHSMANTTAMHLRCNISKGNRVEQATKEHSATR